MTQTAKRKPTTPRPAVMEDAEIAARLREAVAQVNHFCHVALHHGLYVELTPSAEKFRAISDVCVMRPLLPEAKP